MNGLRYGCWTAGALLRRDLLRFVRQRSRLVGALLPAVLLWLAIGAGLAPSFTVGGQGVDYIAYFFPGVLVMLVLQVSISTTMSVIEDRREGFLQGVLVSPGPRSSLALGKAFGSSAVALIHAALFLVLAPFAGYAWSGVGWWSAAFALAMLALTLTGLGFVIAWWLDSVQGYHVVMSLVLFPLWIVSGAMFPAGQLHPILGAVVRWNPLSYAVSAVRRALHGGQPPPMLELPGASAPVEWAVLGLSAASMLALACFVVSRRPRR